MKALDIALCCLFVAIATAALIAVGMAGEVNP